MNLSEYIKHCQDLLEEHGNIDKFYTQIDDECNGYRPSSYAPALRYLSPDQQSGNVEHLIDLPDDYESLEHWAEENYLDLEEDGTFDMSTLTPVILL